MPRKPREPLPNLHIEGLSSGQPIVRDDFTGETIVGPVGRTPKSAEAYRREQGERKAQQMRGVLVDAGLGQRIGYARKREPVELIPKGKRKVAEFNGKAVLMDKPRWRRV